MHWLAMYLFSLHGCRILVENEAACTQNTKYHGKLIIEVGPKICLNLLFPQPLKKSHIRETKHRSTNADSSKNTKKKTVNNLLILKCQKKAKMINSLNDY